MKRSIGLFLAFSALSVAQASPLRVAVLDFEDQSGMASDQAMGGQIAPGRLAEKGVFVVGKQLVGSESFTLIDRRDFINQIERLRPEDMGQKTPLKPSFLQAAQALKADAVLRGSILSLSPSKLKVNQGGYASDQSILTLRVSLEALDPVDGSVIAIADGSAKHSARQTDSVQEIMSEDDILSMMERAVAEALPNVLDALSTRQAKVESQPKLKVAIKTTADPALVEIDGLLIGTSPITDFEIYGGDHTLTITKPGHQMISKKILFEKNTEIEVPMLREQLSAEELKAIYEKGELSIIQSTEPNLIIKSIE